MKEELFLADGNSRPSDTAKIRNTKCVLAADRLR
jgi:hypothetical protein